MTGALAIPKRLGHIWIGPKPAPKLWMDSWPKLDPWELRKPEVSTGNRFLMRMIKDGAPGPEVLQIFPTHYFIPWQKSAPDVWYDGPDKIYAEQKWGTSTFAYNRQNGPSAELLPGAEVQARHAGLLDRLAGAFGDRQGADQPATAERRAAAKAGADRAALPLAASRDCATALIEKGAQKLPFLLPRND